jgi:hypothetical protein
MYFCQNCGHKLEDELIADNAVFHIKQNKLETIKGSFFSTLHFKQIHLSKRLLFAFILLFVVGASSLGGIYYLKMKTMEKELAQQETEVSAPQEPEIEYQDSFDLSLAQPNMAFGKEELTDYVPFEADFYLAGSNLSSSLKLLWGEDAQNDIIETLSDYIKESFVIFGQKVASEDESTWQTALVLYLSQDELPEEIAERLFTTDESEEMATTSEENSTFLVKRVENAVVVTQYEPFFELIEESAKGTAKNVTHKPKYSSYKQTLAPDGQFVFMNFTNDPNSVIALFESYGPSAEAKDALGEILSGEYSKFVIRRK